MSFDLPNSAVEQLKGFILLCRTKPEILHKPEFKFFRDFMESFGANLPTPPPEEKTDKPAEQGKPKQAEQENMETEVFDIIFDNLTGIKSVSVYDFWTFTMLKFVRDMYPLATFSTNLLRI